MPTSRRGALSDIALALSAAGQIPVSAGPGAVPLMTKDVSALTVQPTGATAAGALAARLSRFVDVKNDFGAKGDGSTDDYAAITAAIAEGGSGCHIHFPPGTYKLSQALIPLSDQALTGDGWGKSVLQLASGVASGWGPLYINAANRVLIEGLYLQGNSVGEWGPATFDGGSTDCFMVNCRTDSGWWGTLIRGGCQRIVLVNCLLNAVHGGHGLEINGSTFCAAEGCTIVAGASAGNGIELYQENTSPIEGTRIIGCDITSVQNGGIKPVGDKGSIFANNYIHDCGQAGIFVVRGENNSSIPSSEGTIIGNRIIGCGVAQTLPGIHFEETPMFGWTITGNVVSGSGGPGINLVQARFCMVVANVITLNRQGGIALTQASDCTIALNEIYDNGAGNGEAGIGVDTATNCTIALNRIGNLNTTNQYSGVQLNNTNSGHLILGNMFLGGAGPAINNSGTATGLRIRNNVGYVTEAAGTATVANGTTSIAVAHGLSTTPALKDVMVTQTNLPTNNVRWYVLSVDASNITIATSGDPGASGATFAWQVLIY